MTPHEDNPILHGPRRRVDYLLCRDCRSCSVASPKGHPGIVVRDIGWCVVLGEFVDPDERRSPEDVAECYGEDVLP